jgi:hypothetical protein
MSTLELFNLSYINPDWIRHCKTGMISSVTSIYGCNETSGPIFLPKINAATSNFDPGAFGKLVSPFYSVRLDNNILQVYIKMYKQWVDTGDKFTLKNGQYVFLGKSVLTRINDYEFNLSQVKELVKKLIPIDHELLIVDEQLCLVLFAPREYEISPFNFADVNKLLSIKFSPLLKISKIEKAVKEQYCYGIKLDVHLLRSLFRKNHDYKNSTTP